MKWRNEMTEEELKLFLEHEEELDAAYSDYLVEKAESQRDAAELETEADLYRYWMP